MKMKMKFISIKGFFVGILVVSALSVKAIEIDFKPIENEGKAVVTISKLDAEVVYLSVEDENEEVVFFTTRVKNTEDFSKVFNFTKLVDGKYFLIAKTKDDVIRKSFTIENSELKVEEKQFINEPFFKIEDKSVVVYFNKVKAHVSIEGKDGLLFEDEISKGIAARKYNFSTMNKGTYSIIVSVDEYVYNQDIKIE